MKYTRARLEAIGYELAPVVVTSAELEQRLAPLYERLHLSTGQLEALTGIKERRWWTADQTLVDGASAAASKALAQAGLAGSDVEVLIYAGVCRELFEPATACAVADRLKLPADSQIYDLSNACLGMLNGVIDIANRIEPGQIRAGLIVSCESAREINDLMIEEMLGNQTMQQLTLSLATLTGGSGAAALLITDGSFEQTETPQLVGAVARARPEHHALCRWGLFADPNQPHTETSFQQRMQTDSVNVLKHGLELGQETWSRFLTELDWQGESIDRVICHQVGSSHQAQILRAFGVSADKDFSSYPHLGNIGTVSLPLTAALASQRGFLQRGQRVAFLGIGSGLNCMMLGWQW
jgi:3-oxoacyl-[acyl-carrier-protein] synthase III